MIFCALHKEAARDLMRRIGVVMTSFRLTEEEMEELSRKHRYRKMCRKQRGQRKQTKQTEQRKQEQYCGMFLTEELY